MHRRLAWFVSLSIWLPALAWAAPIPISSAGACPAGVIPESLSICHTGGGFGTGPGSSGEQSFPGGSGSVQDGSTGTTALWTVDVSSSLGTASWDVVGDKFGLTSFGTPVASGRVHWRDTVTIDAPGLTGQTGSFQAAILLTQTSINTANLGTALSVNTLSSFVVDVTTQGTGWRIQGSTGFFESQAGGFEDRSQGDSPGVLVTGDLTFTFGTPFLLDVELTQGVNVGVNGGNGTALADLTGSARWLGLPEVRDVSSGQLVSNFSLSSNTGTAWAGAIPEPATAWLLGAGVLAGYSASRRRASS